MSAGDGEIQGEHKQKMQKMKNQKEEEQEEEQEKEKWHTFYQWLSSFPTAMLFTQRSFIIDLFSRGSRKVRNIKYKIRWSFYLTCVTCNQRKRLSSSSISTDIRGKTIFSVMAATGEDRQFLNFSSSFLASPPSTSLFLLLLLLLLLPFLLLLLLLLLRFLPHPTTITPLIVNSSSDFLLPFMLIMLAVGIGTSSLRTGDNQRQLSLKKFESDLFPSHIFPCFLLLALVDRNRSMDQKSRPYVERLLPVWLFCDLWQLWPSRLLSDTDVYELKFLWHQELQLPVSKRLYHIRHP